MFGTYGNKYDFIREVLRMKRLDEAGQKEHVKKMWKENPVEYFEWKEFCIENNRLPEFFGTRDNPIHIDESKL